jgi:tRNA pseudouridine65 synthase
MQQKFHEGQVKKKYLAIVRGFTPDKETIDYPLKSEKGILQEALTKFQTLARTEIDLPYLEQLTSRYSLVEVEPLSGRMHQIRKHFAHIFYPIIGDRPHGCNKQNKLFKEKWNMNMMMLHASSIDFIHPVSEEQINIKALPSIEFMRTIEFLDFNAGSNFY